MVCVSVGDLCECCAKVCACVCEPLCLLLYVWLFNVRFHSFTNPLATHHNEVVTIVSRSAQPL
jgi:hypothetical protein